MVLGAVAGASTFAFGPRWTSTDWTCPDTDNNGVCDGLEDFDGDGVLNNQDPDFVGSNAQANPYFVDEDGDGVCDYQESWTTRLGGIGARRGGRWTR